MELVIHQEIFIPRTPSEIWDFLINQDGLKVWFQARKFIVDIDQGGGYIFTIERNGQPFRISGETALLHFEKQLIFTWFEQDRYGRSWFNPTNVIFDLNPAPGGTNFKLIHNGFKYLPAETQAEICKDYETYWAEQALPCLQTLLQ